MAHADFLDALAFVDWIGIESKSSGRTREKIPFLKLELRFLAMFLKYTANRCTENNFLKDLSISIEDVGKDTTNLNALASSRERKSAVDGAVRDILHKITLLKPRMQVVLMEVLRSLVLDMIVGPGVGSVDTALDLVNQEVNEIQMQVSSLSVSGSLTSDELIGFIDSLLENLELLPNLLEPSLEEVFNVLKEQLDFLKSLYSLTAARCNKHDELNRLYLYVQAIADRALYLTNYCVANEIDEDMTHRLALALSKLVQIIDPVTPESREIYMRVLKASISLGSTSQIYTTRQTLVVFVGSLLKMTSKLLCWKDQIEMLHVELRSLEYFLKDTSEFPIFEESNYLLASIEDTAIRTGYLFCSLFEGGVNRQEVKEMMLSPSTLLDTFKIGKKLLRELYLNIGKAHISNFPRTDEQGALDCLLQNLNELLSSGLTSIELLKDHIQIVHRDLQFLQSFLPAMSVLRSFPGKITEQQHVLTLDLWWQIVHVIYEVQYVIDLFKVEDGPVLRHMLWLSDLIEDIKLIKTKINEIHMPDESNDKLQREIAMITKSHGMSQRNDPGIDEEMVGFEDVVESVTEELLCGSVKLQIISIVGMPGLGKTFLARRIYNDVIMKNHFHVRAWCNIGQVYERKELLTIILSQIVKSSKDMTLKTDEELAAELYSHLCGQRYLIVLDNIWDISAWDILKRSFRDDRNRSRIVFTSRSASLASQVRKDSTIHPLRPLSHAESWKLLERKIFGADSCPLELHEIGMRIAKACHGLPLSIVVVAGSLARTETVEAWRDIAVDLTSHSNNAFVKMWMDVLDISYKNLPDYLKSCLLYFGAFLPGQEIPVMNLMLLWIAEGFVRGNNPNLEGIAEGYLRDLIDRHLIIASKGRPNGGIKACLIHDVVHLFCVAKAEEENFLGLIQEHELSSSRHEQHRLSIHYRQRSRFTSGPSGPYVRSLLLFAPGILPVRQDEVSAIFLKFKLLKVLDLMCMDLGHTFPEGIASLALLRYLAVFGRFNSLPPSITRLRELESFLVKTVPLVSLSHDVLNNMMKLRHLQMKDGMRLVQSSSGNCSQLDNLQCLSRLYLHGHDDMKIIQRFPNLKILSCIFEESWDFSGLSLLEVLHKLESLKISYDGTRRYPYDEFSLPQNIKRLTMSGFRLRWEQISVIGKLSNLEILKLLSEAFEGEAWNMEEGEVFPKLKFLKLESLDIGKWTAFDRGNDHFPFLERLILEDCAQLEAILFLEDIHSLKMIQVENCNHALEESMKQLQKDQELGIGDLHVIIKPCETKSENDFHLIQASGE